MKNLIILTLLIILLSGCVPNKTYKLNTEFSKDDLKGKTITIMPIAKKAFNIFTTAAIDDLKKCNSAKDQKSDEFLQTYIYEKLVEKTADGIINLELVETELAPDLYTTSRDRKKFNSFKDVIGEDNTTFRYPKEEYLKELGVESDYVLFISAITFNTDKVKEQSSYYPAMFFDVGSGMHISGGVGGGGGYDVLKTIMKVKYTIWNYSNNTSLLHGINTYYVSARSHNFNEDTFTTTNMKKEYLWEEALSILPENIFKHINAWETDEIEATYNEESTK